MRKQTHFDIRLILIFFLCGIILNPLSGLGQDHDGRRVGGTVFIGMKGDFDSFNELNASDSDALQVIQNMLFMRLTRLDENLSLAPYLAKRWEFSRGDSVLTYYLRSDVFWTDGVPTTAEDVLFTYQLAIDPKVAYPARSRFDLTQDVEILDTYTVRFRFKKPYPDPLFDTQIPILPKHILEKIAPESLAESDFNRRPVGNGPFKLVEWKANQQAVFEANLQFAFGRPALDRVVFVVIPDETVLLTSLITGALDMAPSLTPLGFKQVQSQKELRVFRYKGLGFTFMGWNNKKPLFTKKTRQALTYAIDRKEIIDTLLEGFAQEAKGPLLPVAWAYDPGLAAFPYDPEIARTLLQEEGWGDSNDDDILDKEGQKFEFSIVTNAGSQIRKDAAVMVQAQLQKIGVKAHVETTEWNLFIDKVFVKKDFDAVISGWDADFTVNPTDLWHSKAIDNGYNFISYHNPKVDELLEKGRRITRNDLAKPIWREFQKIIVEDSPYTFLFIPDRLAGCSLRVNGVKMDSRGFLVNIEDWWVSDK